MDCRFHTRGLDDDGHVANWVETEQLLCSDTARSSFTQVCPLSRVAVLDWPLCRCGDPSRCSGSSQASIWDHTRWA